MRTFMRGAAIVAALLIAAMAWMIVPAVAGNTVMSGIQVGTGGVVVKQGNILLKNAAGTLRGTIQGATGTLSFAPTTTTSTAWLMDFSTLTTGNGLKIVIDSDICTTGDPFGIYGGSSGATAFLTVEDLGVVTFAPQVTTQTGVITDGSTLTSGVLRQDIVDDDLLTNASRVYQVLGGSARDRQILRDRGLGAETLCDRASDCDVEYDQDHRGDRGATGNDDYSGLCVFCRDSGIDGRYRDVCAGQL
jgi:hypothetical protein